MDTDLKGYDFQWYNYHDEPPPQRLTGFKEYLKGAFGNYNVYNGYKQDFSTYDLTQSQYKQMLDIMRHEKYIDKTYTKGIYLGFTLQYPATEYFVYCQMLIEMLPAGEHYPTRIDIYPFKVGILNEYASPQIRFIDTMKILLVLQTLFQAVKSFWPGVVACSCEGTKGCRCTLVAFGDASLDIIIVGL